MPNLFASLVYLIWPIILIVVLLKYPTKKSIFIAFTGSLLFLPHSYFVDFFLIPPFERTGLTSLTLLILFFILRKKIKLFRFSWPFVLIAAYLTTFILSAFTNQEPVVNGSFLLPSVTYHDAFADIFKAIIWFLPFLLGRSIANHLDDTQLLFKVLVASALIYTLPMLFEIRMSPHLHYWIYGYMSSDFIQNVRDGGYRPVVFYGHGLALAFWFSTAVISAFALQKNKIKFTKFKPITVTYYLLFVLILCKTWSAMFYAISAMLLLTMLKPSRVVKFSLILSLLVLFYPVSKIFNVFPDNELVSLVAQYNVDRAQSLEFRFDNEEILLDRALKKPIFGWGGWGRNRVFNEWGGDSSVTDGVWIIQLGLYGIVGFVLYYSILITPLIYALKNFKYIREKNQQIYIATLSYILCLCIIDSIPNSGMVSVHLFLAGSLWGQSEAIKKTRFINVSSN